jgi:hypothetical protein
MIGAFPLDVAWIWALGDNLRTDASLQDSNNTRYAVKYQFFLGIVYVWWLLIPSKEPIPHKATHSNLMRGLGSIV